MTQKSIIHLKQLKSLYLDTEASVIYCKEMHQLIQRFSENAKVTASFEILLSNTMTLKHVKCPKYFLFNTMRVSSSSNQLDESLGAAI